jgi:hypothetical protein
MSDFRGLSATEGLAAAMVKNLSINLKRGRKKSWKIEELAFSPFHWIYSDREAENRNHNRL